MRAIYLFAACIMSLAVWSVGMSCLAHRHDFHRADFTTCTVVHNGPIERPDGYTTHPFASKGGVA